MVMDLRDFFRLRCSAMLVTERDIWQMNNVLVRECRHPQVKEILERENEPARVQISHLEQVVDQLGGIIGPEGSPEMQGLLHAHRLFMEMNPPQQLLSLNAAIESIKMKHLEIAGYLPLIEIARQLNEQALATLLQENLESDQRMLTELEQLLPQLLTELSSGQQAA
ncbi:MAG: DUF892 family protein [Armatimonadota bacterium]